MNWFNRLKHSFSDAADTPADTPASVDTDARKPAHVGLIMLLVGFGGFMLWATFAPLDAGATAPASVKVASNRKTIQHLTGGIVDSIDAKEGQTVKKGQVLMRLNPTQANAQLGISQGQFITARTMEDRLMAERDHKTTLVFSKEITEK